MTSELEKLCKENEFLRTCSVVELSIRNPNIKSWMREMESRLNIARGKAAARKILLEQVPRDTLTAETLSTQPVSATGPGPVVEVTRQEVVSGRYGRVGIFKGVLTAPREIGIRLFGMSGKGTDITLLTASEVRNMRDVLDAILPVLEAE